MEIASPRGVEIPMEALQGEMPFGHPHFGLGVPGVRARLGGRLGGGLGSVVR